MDAELNFGQTATDGSVTELQRQFPHLPPHVLVTLAFAVLLSRSVTPFRLCGCGCCEPVTGKAKFSSPACRKRLERERNALRAAGAKNLNLVLQYEIPFTIPAIAVTVQDGLDTAGCLTHGD